MNVRIVLTALFVCASERTVMAAEPGAFQSYLDRAGELFRGSPTAKSLETRMLSAERGIDAALFQSPFTLRASARHGQYRRDRTELGLLRLAPNYDFAAGAALDLALRSSFRATFASNASLVDRRVPSDIEIGPELYDATLRLSYDLVRGGDTSPANDRARAAAMRALQLKLDSRAGLIAAELELLRLAVPLYGVRCKLAELVRVEVMTKALLGAADVQLKSRVISETDVLNFRSLDTLVKSRRAVLELQELALLQNLGAYGRDVSEALLRPLAELTPELCMPKPELATLVELRVTSRPGGADELAARAPALAAAEAGLLAITYDLRAIRTEQRPGVSPFASAQAARIDPIFQTEASAFVGLELDWNIPGERGERAIQAAELALASATERRDEERLRSRALVARLAAEVSGRAKLLPILADVVASSEKVIETLRVQLSIGDAESLNLASAYLNRVDAKLAETDSWLELLLGARSLEIVEHGADESAADSARVQELGWIE